MPATTAAKAITALAPTEAPVTSDRSEESSTAVPLRCARDVDRAGPRPLHPHSLMATTVRANAATNAASSAANVCMSGLSAGSANACAPISSGAFPSAHSLKYSLLRTELAAEAEESGAHAPHAASDATRASSESAARAKHALSDSSVPDGRRELGVQARESLRPKWSSTVGPPASSTATAPASWNRSANVTDGQASLSGSSAVIAFSRPMFAV
mmetsp:Transcript_28129/g.91906  ORF Transcript_28129/g.91906 Transcript_28129/m.91906 type:complete len:214 (-) Transcript_28129:223-864(-)